MDHHIIVLIREDLRIHDHPALYKASQEGKVIPLYILDEGTSQFPTGEAKKWWLHQNLESFQTILQSIDGKLWVDKGEVEEILPKWVKRTNARAVYWNRVYEPNIHERDRALAHTLSSEGIEVQTFEGMLLLPPWKIRKEDDTFKANVSLGVDCPYPIVDHKAFRERALHHYNEIKENPLPNTPDTKIKTKMKS